jgi:NinB protein
LNYNGKVNNGTLTIINRRGFDNDLRFFEGREVSITITERKKKRSLSQNAYIHAILIPLFREALNNVGFDEIRTDEQCKDLMKALFLQTEYTNKETGEVIKSFKNTSELSTFEMTEFTENAIKYALDNMNFRIPLPNEQSQLFEDATT